MKLIGAGLPRTGTLTQKVALEMLGLAPCYHMVNVFADMEQVAGWRQALEGRPDWDQLLGSQQCAVDWPASFFYRELMDVYPHAKVLLSVRDPERWEQSMRHTIWDTLFGDSFIYHLSSSATKVSPAWRSYIDLMTEMWERAGVTAAARAGEMSAALERHTEAVKRTVPAERLLVWEPCDGWEPLCDFLGIDVPSAPFPHMNDTDTYRHRLTDMTLAMINEWWQAEQASEAEQAPAASA
jgi:choline dehydrogenase-like flavoprotein